MISNLYNMQFTSRIEQDVQDHTLSCEYYFSVAENFTRTVLRCAIYDVMPMAISGFGCRYRIFARTEPCESRTTIVSKNVLWVYLLLLREGKSADHGRTATSFSFTSGRAQDLVYFAHKGAEGTGSNEE